MEGTKENEDVVRKYEELYRAQIEKLELRQKNQNVDRSSVNFDKRNSKMDLVNKFKNKLKDFTSKYDQIMSDLDKLNLTRFVLEISKILCEQSIPQKDILLFLRFTSRMHQDYEEFSQGLQGDLLKQIKLGAEGNDEVAKANKRKNIARFAFELYLIGLPVSFEKTFRQIKEIMDDNNEDVFFANMNVAVTFIQNFNEEFIGTVARSKKRDYAQNPNLPKIEKLTELVAPEKKKQVLAYFKVYVERMTNLHKNYNKKLQELEDARKQALLSLGKVDEETENKYSELTKKYTSTLEKIQIICDHLDIDAPKLEEDDTIRFEGEQATKKSNQKDDETPKETDQFENEDEYNFYANLIDLKDYVPETLLSKKTAHQQNVQQNLVSPAKGKEENTVENSEEAKDEKTTEAKEERKTEDPKENMNNEVTTPILNMPGKISSKVLLNYKQADIQSYEDLVPKLECCENRDLADDFAKQFCFINNAPNRKRLIKDICAYHKDYQILIPFYCRILGTLNKYFRDVGEYLLEYLQKEYKYIKDKAEKERRLRIILYFCEATKFRLIPPNHVMDCLQECLTSPTGINIDIIILILERTGVFLANNNSKNDRLRFDMQLTQVNNFRTTAHLPDFTLIQLENAYYICRPPERAEIKVKKHLSDLENYILFLLFERLEDNKVAIELSKLPMKECEDFLVKSFMKVIRKGRYGHMNRAAALVNYLGQFYPSFTVKTIDTTIEEIITGLEQNVFTERQKRISFIKFYGELYNYTVIEIDMIFKILYFLLEAGNDQNNLTYKHIIDNKDDIFRISLISTLLETVAPHLKKKKYKNAVDKLLVFFQRYILSKNYIPLNVEFHVLDVLDTLSPDLKKFKNYKEAHEACLKLSKIKEEEVEESKDFNELRVRPEEEKEKSDDEVEREKLVRVSKQEKQFDAELQELLQESIQENIASAGDIKPQKLIKEKIEGDDNLEREGGLDSNKEIEKKIVLCLRQGNKLISKSVYIDKSIDLAQKLSKKEEEDKNERERAMEATKSLHDSDVKKSNMDYEGYVGNSQIRIIQGKKHK